MAEITVEITVAGENAQQTVREILDRLPEGAAVVANTIQGPTITDLWIRAFEAAPDFPSHLAEWWQRIEAAPGWGPPAVLAATALVLLCAWALEIAIARALAPLGLRAPSADGQRAPLRAAFAWGGYELLRIGLFGLLVWLLGTTVIAPRTAVHGLAFIVFLRVINLRLIFGFARFLAAAGEPWRRPTPWNEREAQLVERATLWTLITLLVLGTLRDFLGSIVDAGLSAAVYAIGLRFLEGAVGLGYFWIVRRPFAALARSAFLPRERESRLGGVLADYWYVFYGLLLLLTVFVDVYDYLRGVPSRAGDASRYSFLILVLVPFIIGGLQRLRDRWLEGVETQREQARIVGLATLLEGIIIVGAGVLVLLAWDINPFAPAAEGAGRFVPRVVTAGLVIAVGVSVWRTAAAFLGIYAPEAKAEGAILPEGEGGVGGSRLETVFPVLRASLGALVGAITLMLALSSLGVDIAPLLAGAGIVGLAVGFGAQTLVRDVISGMFYLYEDAFRVGEYVETAEGKGVVEKILLRSVRLRHPRGAIYTIPFGAMGTIRNASRDWVKVKLSFEVAPSEDLERVRKLIKKLGQKLLQDPEIGDKFIEPLKAQGAVDIRGGNFVVSVKFITRPGEQFALRRRVLAELQKTIQEHAIQVSSPRVLVDTTHGPAPAAAQAAAAQVAAREAAAGAD